MLPRIRRRRAWLLWLALPIVVAALDLALLNRVIPETLSVDVGARGDEAMVRDAWKPEQDGEGVTYRWTSALTVVAVRSPIELPGAELLIELGGVPYNAKPVVFALDDTTQSIVLGSQQPRAYHMLLAPSPSPDSRVNLALGTYAQQVGGDTRDLGVRLDEVSITRWDGVALPALPAIASQTTLIVCGTLAVRRLRPGRPLLWATGVLLLALALWIVALDPLLATSWLLRAAGVALAGLLFAHAGVPLLDRALPELGPPPLRRWIYALLLLSVFVRLVGVAYPRFASHDHIIHRERLAGVRIGRLQQWDTPSEFGNRGTIVPSAYYVLASPPGLALGDADLALQWLAAAVDGAGVVLVVLLARRLGASTRAALIAAVLVACLPIQFTALWWGFGPQVLGQWLLVAVAVMAAHEQPPSPRLRLVAGVTLTVALLAHPGAVTLGGVWLAGTVFVAAIAGRRRYAAGWAGVLAAAATVAVALLYVDQLVAQVQSLATPATGNPGMDEATRLRLLWQALNSSFRPLGRAGALAGVLALAIWTRGPGRVPALAWIGSALVFLLVDVATGLQVRYSYFALPLVVIGFGMLLDRMMRTRLLALVGWGIVAAVAAAGLSLWYSGVIDAVKPTLTALTH